MEGDNQHQLSLSPSLKKAFLTLITIAEFKRLVKRLQSSSLI
ncbi:hypothetical protein HMPREF1557_01356 [Streptococcus sobrinus W1703]|uniref:Uncharacterized protein n=1 Tax=Streptococcus sobrinus W1703 TaxID=1227275 RepID=U2IPK5_9STRE|nr:hypothetical protein HMPREF1557_01356 [Streptococcus sobrinus W1703]